MRTIKCKCGCAVMRVRKISDCKNCNHNGWFSDEDGWKYTECGKERTEAEDNCECGLGTNFNNGCHLYVCFACDAVAGFLPLVD